MNPVCLINLFQPFLPIYKKSVCKSNVNRFLKNDEDQVRIEEDGI